MQTCTSSNLQTASSKEIPESKHQNPSSKHQRSSKLQIPSSKRRPRFGAWNLGFLWCLELGVWCLGLGGSLEFGAWDLELFNPPLPAYFRRACNHAECLHQNLRVPNERA